MRLALHIFRKDVERLWPVVLVTFALLGLFVAVESGDTRQATMLDLVLPFAWCLLIGMAIQQDSLVGDRQFWFGLPCGWRPVAIAKAAFVFVTVQAPYFLATAAILAARGFNPLAYFPHLLWKQFVLLALIVPAVAVATIAKNVGQFLLILIATVSGVMFLSDQVNRSTAGFHPFTWDSRWILVLAILSAGALPVTAIQFIRRRTGHSRGIALATALAAAGLYHWLSRDASAAVTAAFVPSGTNASVRLVSNDERPSLGNGVIVRGFGYPWSPGRTAALIPMQFLGLPDPGVRLDTVSFVMTRANGDAYEAQWPNSSDAIKNQGIVARIWGTGQQGYVTYAIEMYSPAVARAVRSGPVTISGRFIARVYRVGTTIQIPGSAELNTREIGHCRGGRSMESRRGFAVVETLDCESPVEDPKNIAAVSDKWNLGFHPNPPGYLDNLYSPLALYPNDPWLSPMHRSAAPFEEVNASGWNVTPSTPGGYVLIDFRFPNLDLNQFIVHDPKEKVK